MNDTTLESRRDRLTGTTAATVIRLLPAMGKIMVIGRKAGVTHERIGPVETVTEAEDVLSLVGICHDARIDAKGIVEIILDTSSVMREQVYPRLNFLTDAGETAFAIVGMEGLVPFTAPLSNLDRIPVSPNAEPSTTGQRQPELDPADPIHPPLQLAFDRQALVRIDFDNGILQQGWTGRIEALKPAMGFLNIMTPDFHLHLKGGSFSDWQADDQGHQVALDLKGAPTPLKLTGDFVA